MSDVTQFLNAIDRGDPQDADRLLPLVYEELRTLAAQRLAREKPGQTFLPARATPFAAAAGQLRIALWLLSLPQPLHRAVQLVQRLLVVPLVPQLLRRRLDLGRQLPHVLR
jgi:hypothetical protein